MTEKKSPAKKLKKKRTTIKQKRIVVHPFVRELLRKLKSKGVKTILLSFTNNDVPKFLKMLRKFEKASRKVVIMVSK